MCRRFAKLFLCGLKARCVAAMKRLKTKMDNGKMKKEVLTFGILASLVFCGCQKEEFRTDTVSEQETFTAVIEDIDAASTRTSLDGSGNVLWKKGDEMSIFAGSTINEEYKVSDESDGKTSAVVTKVDSESFTAGTEIECNVAYYPYTSDASIARSSEEGESPLTYTISGISLPATQIYAEDSFDNGSFPMTAVTSSSTDKNLCFKNVLGGLKLQLKGSSKIKSISVSGNAGETLCGSGSVTVSATAVPSISLTDAAATTVTLNCGSEGVQLNEGTVTCFIIALPPMTMASGFTVTVRDTEGKIMKIKSTKSQTINRSKLLKMPAVAYVGEDTYTQLPLTFTSTGTTGISITKESSPAAIKLEYKTADKDWEEYTVGTEITLTDGAELQFRAGEGENSTFSTSGYDYYKVVMSGTGTVKVSGNIMTLLDNTMSKTEVPEYCFESLFDECANLTDAADLKLPASTVAEYGYYAMFYDCENLTRAPELPAMSLASECYSLMFRGCRKLTQAPALPATDLAEACYEGMFSHCTGLRAAPQLKATKLAASCYANMFDVCRSLTVAPELPATDLAERCYFSMFSYCRNITKAPELKAAKLATSCYESMFAGCSSLTAAPELPATVLAAHCYSWMFQGCSNLTKTPDLPATSLFNDCYSYMFSDCSSLSAAPSELPATVLADCCYQAMFQYCSALTAAPALPAEELSKSCYQGMFQDCSSLTQAPQLKATTLATYCYGSMFEGCSALTAAPALPAEELASYCYSCMFNRCSKLKQAPELKATIMKEYCYQGMFKNTGLETAPALPATSLANYCYKEMFQGCSSLSYIKALFTDEPSAMFTSNWVSGVSSTGTFVKNPSATWNVTGVNGIPEGWTVVTTE